MATSTVERLEVDQFASIAHEWWDIHGKFAPLHRLNPTRIQYLRDQTCAHFTRACDSATPLANLSLLDIGCGGGLVAEPMARLGASVTGIDAAAPAIAVASEHARSQDFAIEYRCTSAETLAAEGATFDIVTALEIIEHVANIELFYDALARLVKPGGLLIVSTLNRTAKSYALGIVAAEYILRWVPKGTHDWKRFVKPSEMAKMLTARGFTIHDTTGLCFQPLAGSFTLNPLDLDVNYFLTATKNV